MPISLQSGKGRAKAALAAAALELALVAAIFWGLAFQVPTAPERALVTVLPSMQASSSTEPPVSQEGEAAPAGRQAEAAPLVAPPVAVELALPRPAAEVAGEGEDDSAGAARSGAGAGLAGVGSGRGSGGTGEGSGAGAVTPPVRIAGALHDRDYPSEAARIRAQGVVVIGFRVRTDGRVDRCTVIRSSGYAILDRLTCRLFEERFRFQPALDAAGQPVEAYLRTSSTWGIR